MRGIAWVQDDRTAYLWSRGFTPRLQTYPGKEVPSPLFVEVCKGEAQIETVSPRRPRSHKLNYNSCRFADGVPVTLKFADAVGEVLISGPAVPKAPYHSGTTSNRCSGGRFSPRLARPQCAQRKPRPFSNGSTLASISRTG